jgi:hypothetical protein
MVTVGGSEIAIGASCAAHPCLFTTDRLAEFSQHGLNSPRDQMSISTGFNLRCAAGKTARV